MEMAIFLHLGPLGWAWGRVFGGRQPPAAGCEHPFSFGALPLQGSLKAKAVSFRMETPLSPFKVQLLPWKPDSVPWAFVLDGQRAAALLYCVWGVSGNVPEEADGEMGVMSAEWLGKDVVGWCDCMLQSLPNPGIDVFSRRLFGSAG